LTFGINDDLFMYGYLGISEECYNIQTLYPTLTLRRMEIP